VNEWKTLGIRGWLEAQPPWFYLAENLGSTCAKLVGAKPDEVVATGTTTINIHSLVNTFYRPCGSRRGIIADELDFPSDIYALKSALELRGLDPDIDLILTPSKDGRFLEESEIVELMDERVALIFLPSVLYRSGQLLNMQYLVEEAHSRGIPIGFDCCHSVGIVEHHFDKLDLDFAVWCSYKYLNGGPGSTAFLYVNRKHFDQKPAIAGWFGCVKDKQFDMSLEFQHSKSAGGWQISSPAILSSAPIEGSLKMILEVGMEEIRRKSLKMTSYLTFLIDELLSQYPYNFSIGTPREDHRRGGHVAIEHKEAMRISAALRTRGIIPDHRRPNIIRVAPVPLYNTYSEVRQLIQSLKEIIEGEEYRGLSRNRKMIS
jgi:kynureninase